VKTVIGISVPDGSTKETAEGYDKDLSVL